MVREIAYTLVQRVNRGRLVGRDMTTAPGESRTLWGSALRYSERVAKLEPSRQKSGGMAEGLATLMQRSQRSEGNSA